MADSIKSLSRLYVDESIHDSLGFIVVAFVFSSPQLDKLVSQALQGAGLVPGQDEFKSSYRMVQNIRMQEIREQLLDLAANHTRIALVVADSNSRKSLGAISLRYLRSILGKNGLLDHPIESYFDEGILTSALINSEHDCRIPNLTIHASEDSRTCFGIQVADLVAHCASQLIRDGLSGHSKEISLNSEAYGAPSASLSWKLLITLRRAMFTRTFVYDCAEYDADTDPVVIGPDDDVVDIAMNPEMLGWGLYISDDVEGCVARSIEATLGRVWLGCMH